MKEFDVTITETLKLTVSVEASSKEEAQQMVSDQWHAGDHILDADNFVEVEFESNDGKEISAERAQDDTLEVLMVEQGQYPRVERIGSDLASLQKAVDGYNNDVTGWRESQRTLFWKDHASFIYQDYGIIDDETVSFNVSLKKFGNNQGQIKEVLEIVGLQGREKDKSLVLSGGEKQRLGIARAILKNASVIFADEPTASLDNSNRQLVVSLLKDCANRGAAIILATHDERLVAECDTVVRLGT